MDGDDTEDAHAAQGVKLPDAIVVLHGRLPEFGQPAAEAAGCGLIVLLILRVFRGLTLGLFLFEHAVGDLADQGLGKLGAGTRCRTAWHIWRYAGGSNRGSPA